VNPEEDTQTAARARVEDALQSAWERGVAASRPLALLLARFDKPESAANFHILERTLRVHCARTHDVFLRRAYDEYIAVLPDTPPAGAHHVGEQIVESMRAEDTDHAQRVSVGVAAVVPDEQGTPSALLHHAERALEAARSHGGDRCIGGSTAGAQAAPKSTLAQLRDLLPGKKKDSDLKRRTD